MRALAPLASLLLLPLLSSCGPHVDCDALCARTLACEVTFAASDDPTGAKIKSGERTDAQACAIGCNENPVVTVDTARCVDAVTITDAATCQEPVKTCFGLK
jgi:hypothetical protein